MVAVATLHGVACNVAMVTFMGPFLHPVSSFPGAPVVPSDGDESGVASGTIWCCNHRGSHWLPAVTSMGPFFRLSALPVFISRYLGPGYKGVQ